MPPDPVITLTTDFGLHDPFVGIMKGIIAAITPQARVIDLTHGIASYDIREAAYTIGMNYSYFPEGTVHIVVVDPGVGSRRRPLLVVAGRHYFIGPDNGVFSLVFEKEKEELQVLHITADHYFLKKQSSTFQGRDVFAPVAARLAGGEPFQNFGKTISDAETVELPMPHMKEKGLSGEIIFIDKFGNAVSNIRGADIAALTVQNPETSMRIFLNKTEIRMKGCYAEATDRLLYAVVNSSDRLEIFLNRGSAARTFNILIGDGVEINMIP